MSQWSRGAVSLGAVFPGAVFLVASLLAGDAHAGDEEIPIAVAITGVVVTDVYFVSRAVALAAGSGRPDVGVSVVEAAVGGLQMVIANGGLAASAHDTYGYEVIGALTFPAMVVSAMTLHGTWSAAQPDADMTRVFALSTFGGINTSWSTLIVSHSMGGKLEMSGAAPWIMATVGPGLGFGIYGIASDRAMRTPWIADTAWSGALMLYGAIALFGPFDPDEQDDDRVSALRLAPSTLPHPDFPPAQGLSLSGVW